MQSLPKPNWRMNSLKTKKQYTLNRLQKNLNFPCPARTLHGIQKKMSDFFCWGICWLVFSMFEQSFKATVCYVMTLTYCRKVLVSKASLFTVLKYNMIIIWLNIFNFSSYWGKSFFTCSFALKLSKFQIINEKHSPDVYLIQFKGDLMSIAFNTL